MLANQAQLETLSQKTKVDASCKKMSEVVSGFQTYMHIYIQKNGMGILLQTLYSEPSPTLAPLPQTHRTDNLGNELELSGGISGLLLALLCCSGPFNLHMHPIYRSRYSSLQTREASSQFRVRSQPIPKAPKTRPRGTVTLPARQPCCPGERRSPLHHCC